ncbi:MFS transporter [Candidatus Falkowbacteria bacterium]|nr:MFS transporter [Candidatus Falkowbacteria bacterium]
MQNKRWFALLFLALGLAIVIIDGTVLNISLPYIIRDLNTSLDALEWVVAGYALIIASILITVGRLGDIFGRKKIYMLGVVLFAIGSLIASESRSVGVLFLGEALIEAIGAAMMLTSSLALVANEFSGRERAIAFGVWGAVAGGASALGPLLGGYLTTFHSWRWSLRINIFIALAVLAGSYFVHETKKQNNKKLDWAGMFLSFIGVFLLVFALIEGQKFGWLKPKFIIAISSWTWPLHTISIIPFVLIGSAVFISAFLLFEAKAERNGNDPLLKLSIFRNKRLVAGLTIVLMLAMTQMGIFFVLPLFLQSALDLSPFQVGLIFLSNSLAALIAGSISGWLTNRIGIKNQISIGIGLIAIGQISLVVLLSTSITPFTLAPALILYGIGIGTTSAQLTNLVLSSVPAELAGEGSAVNATARQLGASLGVSLMSLVLSITMSNHLAQAIRQDQTIPPVPRYFISSAIEDGEMTMDRSKLSESNDDSPIALAIKQHQKGALLLASKNALSLSFLISIPILILALFLPKQTSRYS